MYLVYTLNLCVCVHVSALFGVYVGEMMSSYHAIIPAFGLPGAPLSKNIMLAQLLSTVSKHAMLLS